MLIALVSAHCSLQSLYGENMRLFISATQIWKSSKQEKEWYKLREKLHKSQFGMVKSLVDTNITTLSLVGTRELVYL